MDDDAVPPATLSVDFEWRLVRMVDRLLEERPELAGPLERALATVQPRRW